MAACEHCGQKTYHKDDCIYWEKLRKMKIGMAQVTVEPPPRLSLAEEMRLLRSFEALEGAEMRDTRNASRLLFEKGTQFYRAEDIEPILHRVAVLLNDVVGTGRP